MAAFGYYQIFDLQDFASTDSDEIYAQLKHERQAEFWFGKFRRWQDMRYYEIVPARWLAPKWRLGCICAGLQPLGKSHKTRISLSR
ncbi:MAG: hypothetical protein Ct9H300mP15_11940 [Gemmatimonadota bacterium]|nr:MAG: hypothetical protein Ct9H300mP15_11940 [Gemmatimonadota bacterium]